MSSLSELHATAGTTVGARIVQSASYFQSGASCLLGAQGNAVQRLILSVSSHSLSVAVLSTVNRQVENTMGALYHVQQSLQRKIAAATHIHNGPVW